MADRDDVTPSWQIYPARSLMVDELREFRAVLGLTQAGLAGALGVSRRAVEEWEGGRTPTPNYLELALQRLVLLKTSADSEARRKIERDLEAAGVDLTQSEATGIVRQPT